MEEFEALVREHGAAAERYVRFRVGPEDAEDVLQEVWLAAYSGFSQLRDVSAFKAWLISIAKSKCGDYFRKRDLLREVPLEGLENKLSDGKFGPSPFEGVRETLELLGRRDREVLGLYYWGGLSQAEMARRLKIPVGTVKSRLHTAKRNFKDRYPYRTRMEKGEPMKKLPEYLPEYKIEADPREPFSVKWEELMGWFLVPKLGEKLSWGMYDLPSRKCDHVYDMAVTGRAKVHGIEGVELTAREAPYSGRAEVIERTFVAQLTDTHCRYLATVRNDGGVRNYITFLDGDEFLPNWGFGENNCGNETNLSPKGDIRRSGSEVRTERRDFLLDIVGRYAVTIGGRTYDTVCVMDVETYNCGVVSEQFLDRSGKTVLWRRFNRDDWALDVYKIPWSQRLPENERLTVNGATYVHWYDCITDYIL